MIFLEKYIVAISSLCVLFCFSCQNNTVNANVKEVIAQTKHSPLLNIRIPDSLQIPKEQLVLKAQKGQWYYNEKPFTGYAVKKYKNEQLKESIGYFQGRKYGVAKNWYDNGHIRKKYYYYRNKLVDSLKFWSEDQQLLKAYHYKDGILDGVQRVWHPNGQIAKIMRLDMGREIGMQQAWLENGEKYINYEVVNGRVFGMKRAQLCYKLKNEKVQSKI